MKLSILDQVRISPGDDAADALRHSIELARLGDELGYERYWVAEHHGSEGNACPCPEVLLARIGAETSAIRFGAGGILLPHYSPFKVAETFRTLDALYPDRVDLGIGRAPGCGVQEMQALKRYRVEFPFAHDFEEQLTELLRFLNGDFPADHPFREVKPFSGPLKQIPVWLLGNSLASAAIAARLGLSYAFAQFISPAVMQESMETYRSQFHADNGDRPCAAILAVSAVCVESDRELRELASVARQSKPAVTPTATPRPASEAPAAARGRLDRCRFVGTPERVRDDIVAAASIAGAEEVMILAPFGDHQTCVKSYRLLAEAFHLRRRGRRVNHGVVTERHSAAIGLARTHIGHDNGSGLQPESVSTED